MLGNNVFSLFDFNFFQEKPIFASITAILSNLVPSLGEKLAKKKSIFVQKGAISVNFYYQICQILTHNVQQEQIGSYDMER